jgi:hypothetical protein
MNADIAVEIVGYFASALIVLTTTTSVGRASSTDRTVRRMTGSSPSGNRSLCRPDIRVEAPAARTTAE